MIDVVVGLGANLSDRERTIELAIEKIACSAGTCVISRSLTRQTAPVGVTDQPVFLNAAIRLLTKANPRQLLMRLLSIEHELGRVRDPSLRWGPRLIDLDILWVRGVVVSEDDLVIPHPRVFERRFALEPLVEVAGDEVDPRSGRALRALLEDLLRNSPQQSLLETL